MQITRRKPMTRKFVDLSGRRFGTLTVTRFTGFCGKHSAWQCTCDCGKTCRKRVNYFSPGRPNIATVSCSPTCPLRACITHGLSGSRIYRLHSFAKHNWRLASEWINPDVFERFFRDLKPTEFIARRDASHPLGPDNYIVTTQRCFSKCRMIRIGHDTKSLTEWGEVLGVSRERATQLHNAGNLESRVLDLTR